MQRILKSPLAIVGECEEYVLSLEGEMAEEPKQQWLSLMQLYEGKTPSLSLHFTTFRFILIFVLISHTPFLRSSQGDTHRHRANERRGQFPNRSRARLARANPHVIHFFPRNTKEHRKIN